MNTNGRNIDKQELELLASITFNYPDWLIDLQNNYSLIGQSFSLIEEMDASGFGVEMQWMTIGEQLEEIRDLYPGKIAFKYNYFPIGKCLEGSGDPYFISSKDGELKIYRIPHDIVLNEELDEKEIEYICFFEDLLDFKE